MMVCDVLKDIRNKNTSSKFQQWFDMARNLAEELDVSVSKPRTVGRQRHRDNAPAKTVADYYKINLMIPFLDHILMEMDSRFSSGQAQAIQGFSGENISIYGITHMIILVLKQYFETKN